MEQDSKRAILAVILSGIVLFGWQYFFPTQPVQVPVKAATKVTTNQTTPATNNSNTNTITSVDSTTGASNIETFSISNGEHSYLIDNNLNILETKSINTTHVYPKHFEEVKSELYLNSTGTESKPFFNFTKVSDSNYTISTQDGLYTGSVVLDEKGLLDVQLSSAADFNYKFIISTKKIELSSQNHNQFLVLSKGLETIAVGKDDSFDAMKVNWFGLDFNYHFSGYILPENTLNKVKTIELKDQSSGDTTGGTLVVSSINKVKVLNYKNVFLQKNYDDLLGMGYKLDLAVDFGLMSIVAVPILRGLQFFFTVFPNYGISIILLTIFIRMLTFPLQYKSFKSMKKMQVIQPELTKIKEKFKDNPQKMQQETMALFKKAGANPLGGCLPLILQMPVFFAFYRVLYSAVELVDAKFAFWIIDLSAKDPYYVLPVLMSLAMFLNMKLTPSPSADPAQQKIMMFMPLFFGFIMKDLPAGLTLYIFVSTIMGMLQQLFVYKRVS